MKRTITAIQITNQLSVSITEFNRLMTILAGMSPDIEFTTRLFSVTKSMDGSIRISSRITEFEVDRLLRQESLSNCGLKIVCKI